MFGFWMFIIGLAVGVLAAAAIGEVWSMLIDDREDERAAAAARLSLLRRIPPEVYEELGTSIRKGRTKMWYCEYYDIEKKLWIYCPESKGSQTHARNFAVHYSKLTGRYVRVRQCAG